MLTIDIYKILTNKKFRASSLPPKEVENLILEKIKDKISKNLPIEIFQFWGGCKNPNLSTDNAEMCEKKTLENLKNINEAVRVIYKPGLKFYISPGDGRVQKINYIPKEKTNKYVETLKKIVSEYDGLFTVVPVSELYKKYEEEFFYFLEKIEKEYAEEICNQPDFEKLIHNAKKNIFIKDLALEYDIKERSKEAAKNYIVYRIAEEEARIFRDYEDCIRSFFIKYIPFYKKYIKDISKTTPRLDCSLVFYTGEKGNITQPWQAIGKIIDDKIAFMSQNRL